MQFSKIYERERNAEFFHHITIAIDFLILNLGLVVSYLLNEISNYNQEISQRWPIYLLCFNLAYAISLWTTPIIVYSRTASPDLVVRRVVRTITVFIIVLFAILGMFKIPTPARSGLVVYTILLFFFISLERVTLRHMVRFLRSKGNDTQSVVLMGQEENISELITTMQDSWNGYKIEGTFSDVQESESELGTNYLGPVSSTIEWLKRNPVNEVYCCLPSSRGADIAPVINYCENHLIRFYIVPNVRNYLKRKMFMERIGDVLVLSIRPEPMSSLYNRFTKRVFDIIGSALLLITVYPLLYLVLGFLIKRSSKGPILFCQERTGLDGKSFKCYKFRSMRVNGDSDTRQATKDDPRKTAIGEFMRRTNLDEFPQLLNVLKGNMSFVGPRPHMLAHTEEYSHLINHYMIRHLVKPGITGWAQVKGFRGETKLLEDMENRVKADIWYIENWTFWLDMRIIYKTIRNMIHGEKKAY